MPAKAKDPSGLTQQERIRELLASDRAEGGLTAAQIGAALGISAKHTGTLLLKMYDVTLCGTTPEGQGTSKYRRVYRYTLRHS